MDEKERRDRWIWTLVGGAVILIVMGYSTFSDFSPRVTELVGYITFGVLGLGYFLFRYLRSR
jgi:hypothetical protein